MKNLSSFLLYFIFILIVLAAFLFTIRNPEPVPIWLGVEFAPRPLSVWLTAAFIGGGLTGMVLGAGVWRRLKTRLEVKQLNQKIAQQTLEITRLKTQLIQLEIRTKE